ncbi:MAG: cyclic-di-AMP receptor [Armatimonadota bacterium]|jgi:uncharacterized protein YaaQ
MKLLIAVVNSQDARSLRDALIESGFRFTEIGSTGGFLRQGNLTLLIGVAEDEVQAAMELIGQHCRTREEVVDVTPPDTRVYSHPVAEALTVPIGGAQVFVVNVEQVVQI